MTSSISFGYTFSPPEISMSLARSISVTKPSASRTPTSPVNSHPPPSRNTAAVCSGSP
jgi:hypothetical protein